MADLNDGDRPGDSATGTDTPGGDATSPLKEGVLAQITGYHVALAAVATTELFDRHVGRPMKLRKVEFSLLMLLHANGPQVPKRLAQELALSAPALTQLLDTLQERALLRRQRNPADGRSQLIVLTDAGAELSRRSAVAASHSERELFQRLSAAEHAMLIELLHKVYRRA
jgi:DNA-binding MarR family transcriptional regulator